MPLAYPPAESPHIASMAVFEQREPMLESEYERLEYRQAVELACVRHSSLYATAFSPPACRPAPEVCVVPVGWNNNMYSYTAYGIPVSKACASGVLRFARPEHVGADTARTQAAAHCNGLMRQISPDPSNEVNSEDEIIYDNFAREAGVKATAVMLNACQPQSSEFAQTNSRSDSDPLQSSDTYMTVEDLYQNGHPSNPNQETQLPTLATGHLQNNSNWLREVKMEVSKEAGAEVLSKSIGKTLSLEYSESSSTSTPDELVQTAGQAASLRRKQT